MNAIVCRGSLVAFGLAAAACAVEVGTVTTSVSCAGAGCVAAPAELRVAVTDCDEEVGVYGEEVRSAVLLGTAANVGFSFDNVLEGTRCVQAFLDVDTNGVLSTGDVMPSAALALDDDGDGDPDADDTDLELENEIPVEVEEDGTANVDVVLDTIVP